MKDASIVDDYECHIRSVAKVVLLSLRSQLVEHLPAPRLVAPFKTQHVCSQYATMRPHSPVLQSPFLEQPHDIWSRDVQEIGGLLRGKLSVHRHNRDSVAVRHLPEHLEKQFERLSGYDDGLRGRCSFGAQKHIGTVVRPCRKWSQLTQSRLGVLGGFGRGHLERIRHNAWLSNHGSNTDEIFEVFEINATPGDCQDGLLFLANDKYT